MDKAINNKGLLREKGRIQFFDLAKGILIITVAFEHLIIGSLDNYSDNRLLCYVTSFNMVAFFIISGYMLKFSAMRLTTLKGLCRHLSKRVFQLFVPIIVWGAVRFYLLYPEEQYGWYEMIKYVLCKDLWFLRCLFVCDGVLSMVLFFSAKFERLRIYLHNLLFVVLSVAAVVLLEYVKDVDFFFNCYYYLPFLVVGLLLNCERGNVLLSSPLCLGFSAVGFCLLVHLYTFSGTSIFIRYPLAILGSFSLLTICKSICNTNRFYDYLVSLGKFTLPIYCMHLLFLKNVHVVFFEWHFLNLIALSIIASLLVAVCFIICKILSICNYTDFLFNGNVKSIKKLTLITG